MIPTLPRPAALQLIIIRTAMMLGLVLFGVATMYIQRKGPTNAMSDDTMKMFSYIFIAMAVSGLGAMIFIRSRLGAIQDTRKQVSMYLVGYALAEATALFGAVTWYVGGAREWFIAGLVLMVVSFQVLPVKRSA